MCDRNDHVVLAETICPLPYWARLFHALLKLFLECNKSVGILTMFIQEYPYFIILSLYLSATSSCAI